jgi:U11/U12 small nuclear ribonucleoprotein 65 kDa protein
MPRFANYSPGDPTQKLFIKNLAKGVKQEDLEYIFGRYFESDEEMHERLQIKVMTGRHQGGAFVTFPSVEQAQRAIYDIHGFVWKDKPMVIVRFHAAS